jgi:hypothetical protein
MPVQHLFQYFKVNCSQELFVSNMEIPITPYHSHKLVFNTTIGWNLDRNNITRDKYTWPRFLEARLEVTARASCPRQTIAAGLPAFVYLNNGSDWLPAGRGSNPHRYEGHVSGGIWREFSQTEIRHDVHANGT